MNKECELKEQIKVLKEKIKKKTERIRKLVKKNENMSHTLEFMRNEYAPYCAQYHCLSKLLPHKYYQAEYRVLDWQRNELNRHNTALSKAHHPDELAVLLLRKHMKLDENAEYIEFIKIQEVAS